MQATIRELAGPYVVDNDSAARGSSAQTYSLFTVGFLLDSDMVDMQVMEVDQG